jgi:acylpyruvate hydrolase
MFAGSRKIVCAAKNYAAHKVEMGGSSARLERVAMFLKPPSSVIYPGQSIVKPSAMVGAIHHEVELGVIIGKKCKRVPASADWKALVSGYCLALDMTARDEQAAAKASGMPWTRGKCWDTFTALSEAIPAAAVRDPHDLELYLSVNGVERQRGSTSLMLHNIPQLISEISEVMTLEAGDLILTGTPAGVGPVEPGQTITAGITGLIQVTFPVIAE